MTGGVKKLHHKELHNLYSLPNMTSNKETKMCGICSMSEKMRCIKNLVHKFEGNTNT